MKGKLKRRQVGKLFKQGHKSVIHASTGMKEEPKHNSTFPQMPNLRSNNT